MKDEMTVYQDRMKWFHEARFGMFIHWGLYSLLERGEWVMFRERIKAADYARLADRFRPTDFDAKKWASLAVEAGMKYAVFTARHHDGFSLYDSKVSKFNSVQTAARRDFVAEFVDACRGAGLRVGLYYSLKDWRFPGYWEPHKFVQSAQEMVQRTHDQVRELLSQYGKIDVLWYDGSWVSIGRYPEIKDADFWRASELNAMARKLQPDIIINNRAGTAEDIDTPEQHVTASKSGRAWESCMTIGHPAGWGYVRYAADFKTVPELLHNLVKAAADEGNFLLNVGPEPSGTIRTEEVTRLREIGQWLQTYGEGIYGSQRCPLPDDRQPGGGSGLWTRNGNAAYLYIPRWPGKELVIPLVAFPPRRATLLGTGTPLTVAHDYNHRLVIRGLPAEPPHPIMSAIKLEFDQPPQVVEEKNYAAWLTGDA